MQSWEIGASLVAGGAAIWEDLRARTIPNWIPLLTLGAGLFLHGSEHGWPGIGTSLAGCICGFGVFLAFYLLGGLGGGDVKLMAGFGAILGPGRLWTAAWLVAVAGGLMASGVWLWLRLRGRSARGTAIPYAPAICAGVWLSLLA